MKIIVFSDIHYGNDSDFDGFGSPGYVNIYGKSFEKFLPSLFDYFARADLIVNLGDSIANENPATDIIRLKKFRSFFENKGKNVVHLLGNHDLRNINKKEALQILGQKGDFFYLDAASYRHIFISANETGRNFPFISPFQLKWLNESILSSNYPCIVYCHFPCLYKNIEKTYYYRNNPEYFLISNRIDVINCIESSRTVEAFVSGHLHFSEQQRKSGIIHYTVPSLTENDGKGNPLGLITEITLNGNNELTIMNLKLN